MCSCHCGYESYCLGGFFTSRHNRTRCCHHRCEVKAFAPLAEWRCRHRRRLERRALAKRRGSAQSTAILSYFCQCVVTFSKCLKGLLVFFSIRVFVSVNFRPSMGPIFLHAIFIYLQLEVATGWHKVLPRTPIGSWRQRPIKLARGSKTSGAMAATAFTGWIGWRV